MDAYLDGPGAGRRERARPGRHPLGGRRSSSPASTPRSTSGWTRSAPTRRWRCAARPAIANARLAYAAYEEVFQRHAVGRARPRRARTRSGRCGRRPGSRTPTTTTPCTSTELVVADTVNTMPEKTMRRGSPTTARSTATRSPAPPRRRRRCSTPSSALGVDLDDVFRTSWRTRASRSSRPRGASCSTPSRASSTPQVPSRPRGSTARRPTRGAERHRLGRCTPRRRRPGRDGARESTR